MLSRLLGLCMMGVGALVVMMSAIDVFVVDNFTRADVQERVIDLPEDGNKWFTSLFLNDEWQNKPQESMVVNAFETDRRLLRLRDQTIFNTYTRSDPHYRQAFAESINKLPAITVQRPDGTIVYKASGSRIPRSGAAIAESIERTSRRRCWRRGQCEPDEVVPYQRKDRRSLLPFNPRESIPDIIDMGQKAVATKRFLEGPALQWMLYAGILIAVFFLGNKFKGT